MRQRANIVKMGGTLQEIFPFYEKRVVTSIMKGNKMGTGLTEVTAMCEVLFRVENYRVCMKIVTLVMQTV